MDEQEFIEKYGATTNDGVPRFTDDYAFLCHPIELDVVDAYKIGGMDNVLDCVGAKAENFWCDLGDQICDKFGW